METEKHFILECEAFKDSRHSDVNILTTSSWVNLFNKGTMVKLGELIIKLNRKMVEMQKSTEKRVCPIDYAIFSLANIKNNFFLSFNENKAIN